MGNTGTSQSEDGSRESVYRFEKLRASPKTPGLWGEILAARAQKEELK